MKNFYYVVQVLQIWLVFFALTGALLGWGISLRRVSDVVQGIKRAPGFAEIWLGLAVMTLGWQVLQCFWPLQAKLVVCVFLGGWLLAWRALWQWARCARRALRTRRGGLFGLVGLLLLSWLTGKAQLAPMVFDSGLYHFHTVRWLNECSTVPGLGNLHGRLAFNQSYFLTAAALNWWPWFQRGASIINSYYVLLMILESLWAALHLVQHWRRGRTVRLAQVWPSISLPLIFYLALQANLSAPNPDDVVFLLQLRLSWLYWRLLVECARLCRQHTVFAAGDRARQLLGQLMISATLLITFKLSGSVYGLLLCACGCWGVCNLDENARRRPRNLLFAMGLSVLLLTSWMVRGLLLSGYPVYPLPVLRLSAAWADWVVPWEAARVEANWIYSWARRPDAHWQAVLGNWNWLPDWLSRLRTMHFQVLTPLALFSFLVGWRWLMLYASQRRQGIGDPPAFEQATYVWRPLLWLGAPVWGSLIFWFFTAPDVRFAGVLFWLLPFVPLGAALLISPSCLNARKQQWNRVGLGLAAYGLSFLVWFAANLSLLRNFTRHGWQPLPVVEFNQRRTAGGLVLNVPRAGVQVWDAPLLTAPFFPASLAARGRTPCVGFRVPQVSAP